MKFSELQEKIGTQIESDWHQHKNGGGWIHKSAKVDASAFIGGSAIVWGQVSGDARVYGDARVSGDAWVYGDAQVYGNARVYGDAWEKSPLFILGSRHSLTNAKKGYIQIGCKRETFSWWLSTDGSAFAKDVGYTPDEIAEYRLYVKLFQKIGK